MACYKTLCAQICVLSYSQNKSIYQSYKRKNSMILSLIIYSLIYILSVFLFLFVFPLQLQNNYTKDYLKKKNVLFNNRALCYWNPHIWVEVRISSSVYALYTSSINIQYTDITVITLNFLQRIKNNK